MAAKRQVIRAADYDRRMAGRPITRLKLRNFKAFENFSITFGDSAFLVGPNNAGKSTVIAALRAASHMLRIAGREKAAHTFVLDDQPVLGWRFVGDQVDLVDENLRHEFREQDTFLDVVFADDAVLRAVWAANQHASPLVGSFALRHKDVHMRQASRVREAFPSIAFVPVLSPVEHQETILGPDYLKQQFATRRSSRHFRNQLWLLREEGRLDDYFGFVQPHLTEISLRELVTPMGVDGRNLDLYFWDAGSRTDKELFWAGDGIQIWLQILLHVFRAEDRDALILDEPDVFLHPDLQQRLVRVLEDLPAQTITATHSAEVLAEADRESLVWVTRHRRSALRATKPEHLHLLSDALGTSFNLRVARALHARSAVFVEGADAKTLNWLAKTIGASQLARESGIAVIELEGFDRWEQVEPFVWFIKELLEDSVSAYVLLDRDYRSDAAVTAVIQKLRAKGIDGHVWAKHELENYLLVPAAIARLSGAPSEEVGAMLDLVAHRLETEVLGGLTQAIAQEVSGSGTAPKTMVQQAKARLDEAWTDPGRRLDLCPGKELLRGLNALLSAGGHRAVSTRALGKGIRKDEIAEELAAILIAVEHGEQL